jgi:acetyl esterase
LIAEQVLLNNMHNIGGRRMKLFQNGFSESLTIFSILLLLVLFLYSGQTQPAPEAPLPTFADVSYGPHERNVLDFWQAKSITATPLAIFIHGGGFMNGSKDGLTRNTNGIKILKELLDAGISVASISYRLIPQAALPAAHHDGRLALQFLRSKAKEWNINNNRVAAWGGSAGAQICMYLAFHDDMADPGNSDPVLRESTRLKCVATSGGQTTMIRDWWIKNVPQYSPHRDFLENFGTRDEQEYIKSASQVSALSLISADDPPIFMTYNMAPDAPLPTENPQGWKIHHVIFGIKLKEKMDALGIEADLKYPGAKSKYNSVPEFFIAKLKGE